MPLKRIQKILNPRDMRSEGYIRNLILSISLVAIIFIGGIAGYMIIEGFSFVEATYMTVITVSTVGYGEVHQLTSTGRVFTIILIIFTLVTFAYAVTTLSSFILGGGLKTVINEYRMMKKIENLENHVIIAGLGRYGREVTRALQRQDFPIVVVEKSAERLNEYRDKFDVNYMPGDATQDEILLDAGVDRARAIIVTIADDSENVYVCLTARFLNNDVRIISRALNNRAESKLRRAGANFIIKPERSGGLHMAMLVRNPSVVEFMETLSQLDLHFEELACTELNSEFFGSSIKDANLRGKTGVHIIAVSDEYGKYQVNPGPEITIRPNMKLLLIGDDKQIQKFRDYVS